MHEVAKSTPVAFTVFVLAAACFAEVSDWRQFCVQWPTSIPAIVEVVYCGLSLRLPFIPSIHVPDEMVSDIVTYMELQ